MRIKLNQRDILDILNLTWDYHYSDLMLEKGDMTFYKIHNKIVKQNKGKAPRDINLSYHEWRIIEAIVDDRIQVISKVRERMAKLLPHDIMQAADSNLTTLPKTFKHLQQGTKSADERYIQKARKKIMPYLLKHAKKIDNEKELDEWLRK